MPVDLFSKTSIPGLLPREMENTVENIRKSSNQDECLKSTYKILTAKYRGYRMKTFLHLHEITQKDPGALWQKNGFLHCTNMNYVCRILLIKSGFFTENDIRLRWTLVWYISPHQYMQVRIGNRWINVDIWAYVYGINLGDYAHGFHGHTQADAHTQA